MLTYAKAIRLQNGWSQTTVGVATNIPQPTYSDIESGRMLPNRKQLERLVEFFQFPKDRLLKPVEILDDASAALVRVGEAHMKVKRLEEEAQQ